MAKNILTENFAEPINGESTFKVDIHAGDGNLKIDRLSGNEQVLVSGSLQYFERQGLPTRTLLSSSGQATLTLRGSAAGQPWFRLPWSTCNGATEWQIHLNPKVSSDITAHSDGGNIKLDLLGMDVTSVSADTGGGNLEVDLPDNTADLSVDARTGAGNVTVTIGSGITGSSFVNASSGAGNVVVRIPSGVAALIHAATGLGKVIVDPQFTRVDDNSYQSTKYDSALDKIEIMLKSGAGNVIVKIT
jgi:hypothetical protein